jgi:hypothetical protein
MATDKLQQAINKNDFEPYKAMVEVPFPTIALYAFYGFASR